LAPVGEGRLVAHGLRQVEDDPAKAGTTTEELDEERTVTAADVDDELAVVPARAASRSATRSFPEPIARSNAARSSGCSSSQDQKPVPNVRPNVVSPAASSA